MTSRCGLPQLRSQDLFQKQPGWPPSATERHKGLAEFLQHLQGAFSCACIILHSPGNAGDYCMCTIAHLRNTSLSTLVTSDFSSMYVLFQRLFFTNPFRQAFDLEGPLAESLWE